MTGMKEGAGENPFAENDTEETDDCDDGPNTVSEPTTTRSQTTRTNPTQASTESQQPQMQIPYKFRRDGVKDGRDRVPLFLHEETKRAERDALREIEERFGDNVSLTDLREAVVKAGLANLHAVEANLEEWGYGMTFED